jgi:predicted transcriptional regulator
MDLVDLKKIGLTEGELKIYSALLSLGESTRTKVAKKSGVSPSKIYDVANRLLEKGIISSVKKNGVIHFSPANPERIKNFIEIKEKEIEKEKELVDNMLPALLSKYHTTKDKVDVEVFYGWEGMRTVFDDLSKSLGKGDINYVFGASMGQDIDQADFFFRSYHKKVEEKKYSIKIIFNENIRGHLDRIEYYTKNKRHDVKFLYQDTFTEINFYKDTVLFVMLLKNPVVIRVNGKEVSDSFKKFFESMWEIGKK